MNNLFKVYLPPILGESRSMNLLCKAVGIPGRQIQSQEKIMGLVNKKVANGFIVDDVTLTFYLMNDFKVRTYFEKWQELCVNRQNYEVGYYDEYTQPVIIQHIKKGVSFPITKRKLFDSGKIPSAIANRLPKIGPLDLAQGEFDLDFLTGDKVTYTCVLDKAFPTSLNAIELNNDEASVLELTVQLSYKDWFSKEGDQVTQNDGFAEGLAGTLISKFL
tara:strand:+ start:7261 stop:7914 length:654 start_codon:yes stop_codon:yes gene_type:complete